MSNQPTPYPIRVPDELRDQLVERSRNSGRSLHAEIIGILQEAVGKEQQASASLDIDALADTIADRVAARLKDGDS